MKKYIFALVALSLLFACKPENIGPNDKDELTVTGDVLELTDCSAKLTGYANLTSEFVDAEVGIMYDEKQSFTDGKKIVAADLEGNKFTVTITGLEASTTYYYKSFVQKGTAIEYGSVKSFTTKAAAGAVDLGLVITRKDGTTYHLYWAESNLCESGLCAKPEDYGDYYAWGETQAKSNYSSSTYKFGTGPFSKYTNDAEENKTVLDLEDDVAHEKLGGKWRMPTEAEWSELMKKCTFTWTDNYNGTGVKGRIVSASNGNKIFLPAAGYIYDEDLDFTGSYGFYHSSSLYTDNVLRAWDLSFNSDEINMEYNFRYFGFSVRPVTE